jgi:hypothetical protein
VNIEVIDIVKNSPTMPGSTTPSTTDAEGKEIAFKVLVVNATAEREAAEIDPELIVTAADEIEPAVILPATTPLLRLTSSVV